MPRDPITILNAKVSRTGAEGGHSYLKGECDYHGKTVAISAIMVDKAEEAQLQDGIQTVTYEASDYTHGVGLLLSNFRLTKEA